MTGDRDFVSAAVELGEMQQLDVAALELLFQLECSGEDFYNLLADRIGNEDAAQLLRRNGARGARARAPDQPGDRAQAGPALRAVTRAARTVRDRPARRGRSRDVADDRAGRDRRRRRVPAVGRARSRSRGRSSPAAERSRGDQARRTGHRGDRHIAGRRLRIGLRLLTAGRLGQRRRRQRQVGVEHVAHACTGGKVRVEHVGSETRDITECGARVEVLDRGFGPREERLGEHATLRGGVVGEHDHLARRGHGVRRLQPVLHPRGRRT